MTVNVATTVFAVVASLAALPTAAHAAVTPEITAIAVDTDPGTIRVTAMSDSAITAITASLVPVPGGDPVATSTTFTRSSGTDTDGVFRVGRLVASEYGTYALQVTVTDADGDATPLTGTHRVGYRPIAQGIDTAAAPLQLDWDHQEVTATGTLLRFDPKTGETAPWAGQHVGLNGVGTGQRATTDAQGRYTTTLVPTTVNSGAPVTIGVMATVSYPVAGGRTESAVDAVDSVTYTATAAQTRVRLDKTAVTVKYGSGLPVAGVVERLADGTWTPLKGANLDLTPSNPGEYQATSNDTGRFSFAYSPGKDATLTVALTQAGARVQPFLARSSATLAVDVINKSTLVWQRASINEFSELHVEGSLRSSDGAFPSTTRLLLQQSDGKTGWKTLGYIALDKRGSNIPFKIDGYVERPSGYWRLVYAGHKDFQPTTSNVVKASRFDTMITGLNAAPEPVNAGKAMTVTGVLHRLTGPKWTTFANQSVGIYFRAKGTTVPKYVGSVRSNGKGQFSCRLTARKDGYWSAVWWTPSAKYVSAFGAEDFVDVR
jgi:hypothetical protein